MRYRSLKAKKQTHRKSEKQVNCLLLTNSAFSYPLHLNVPPSSDSCSTSTGSSPAGHSVADSQDRYLSETIPAGPPPITSAEVWVGYRGFWGILTAVRPFVEGIEN